MPNEQPNGKNRFTRVLIGLAIVFAVAVATYAFIWIFSHPEETQENVEKVATMRDEATAEDRKEAESAKTIGHYTIQLRDKKVVDCIGSPVPNYASTSNVDVTCDWDKPRQLAPNEKANRQATYVALGNGEQVPCEGNSYIECGWSLRGKQ